METNSPKNPNEKIHLDLWSSLITEEDYATYDPDAAYLRFLRRIGRYPGANAERGRLFRVWRYAASIAILAAGCVAAYLIGKTTVMDMADDYIVEVPAGSQTTLTLPDGTSICLNSGSTLTYPADFGNGARSVTLAGEGLFDVAHDAEHPFIVKTTDLEVKVLGTIFNVKDYPGDSESEVSLYEGSVSLRNLMREQDVVTLSPSQSAVLSRSDSLLAMGPEVQAGGQPDWMTGWLHFDEIPLSDICLSLERRYGISISIDDNSLRDTRFYGSFNTKSHGARDIMEILSGTGKFRYTIDVDGNIIITN